MPETNAEPRREVRKQRVLTSARMVDNGRAWLVGGGGRARAGGRTRCVRVTKRPRRSGAEARAWNTVAPVAVHRVHGSGRAVPEGPRARGGGWRARGTTGARLVAGGHESTPRGRTFVDVPRLTLAVAPCRLNPARSGAGWAIGVPVAPWGRTVTQRPGANFTIAGEGRGGVARSLRDQVEARSAMLKGSLPGPRAMARATSAARVREPELRCGADSRPAAPTRAQARHARERGASNRGLAPGAREAGVLHRHCLLTLRERTAAEQGAARRRGGRKKRAQGEAAATAHTDTLRRSWAPLAASIRQLPLSSGEAAGRMKRISARPFIRRWGAALRSRRARVS